MVKIHGFVYIVLSILMSLYSKFIQNKVQKPSLVLFFWVGVGFIGFGVFRLIISYVMSDKSPKPSASSNPALEKLKLEKHRMQSGESSLNRSNNTQNSRVSSDKNIVACGRCGTKHYSNSNFCHMCGFSLK